MDRRIRAFLGQRLQSWRENGSIWRRYAGGTDKTRYDAFMNEFGKARSDETTAFAPNNYPGRREITGWYLFRKITLRSLDADSLACSELQAERLLRVVISTSQRNTLLLALRTSRAVRDFPTPNV